MPNEGQLAEGRILRQFEGDPRVQEVLGELARRDPAQQSSQTTLQPTPIIASGWLPENVIAVDGSLHPLPLKGGFPASQVCYYSIVSVLLQIAKLRTLDEVRPVPPALFKEVEDSEVMTAVVTGANVVRRGETDARLAFRNYLFETLAQNGLDSTKETLLQTYEHLLANRPSSRSKQPSCPYDDCGDPTKYCVTTGGYTCACSKSRPLFSTDVLDVHNSMSATGENGRMFGEALQVIETLWLMNVIRFFVYHQPQLDIGALNDLAFVMDGPLRIDGEPAWLSGAIRAELSRINQHILERGGKDLLLVGIEKTGNFVEHFKLLDTQQSGSPDRLPVQTLLLLDNAYIREHIAPGERPYGEVTYYGRKFFYKTRTGALLCGCTPMLRSGDANLETALPSQFPRLADILTILDELASARYPNAIIPVLAAHAECAIPLSQGRRVLEMLTKKYSSVLT